MRNETDLLKHPAEQPDVPPCGPSWQNLRARDQGERRSGLTFFQGRRHQFQKSVHASELDGTDVARRRTNGKSTRDHLI